MNLEINKELVVSTAHVKQETMQWLRGEDVQGYEVFLRPSGDTVEFGALVYTMSPEIGDALPPELPPLLALARKHGCKWLRLDCDAFKIDGYETFDW